MRLNHINLCVNDLTEAREFFQNCFDLKFLDQKGKAIVIMSDGHGFTLVLSNPLAFKDVEEIQPYPGGFHIGFLQDSEAQVDQIYQRLKAAGVQLTQEPRNMRGIYGFYFTALNDLLIEVSTQLEQITTEAIAG
ncbi:VOC family protein [Ktedonospora formicarum]|uniref:Glyoxalase n=1 Tax=Ktedonospora formicarum TaxID=2778364 RepID=A0A8J3I211_9CHLR|nr:VOC family protein [Ktedonospora formicarum]GHO47879.1 glyoxalase [Ktedonospora formicarum]